MSVFYNDTSIEISPDSSKVRKKKKYLYLNTRNGLKLKALLIHCMKWDSEQFLLFHGVISKSKVGISTFIISL